ncbi:DUF4231 domain-containing protein [Oxynema aestuarii]|uniref:DUF4231 domain-containing protein n=1 Tax=Oxynema aestuarii AP17 TaxID=2064643 RepID=A0A6H1TW78_9CYAN|nr:DUF4231 domain-containing protein [Oxynema aestuarii]QIZ70852.1 DUF4231 domain-containing protein [Oxynema aestuarii AP17]RMH72145.1 MAG: DUF4231 domain-containing protein [Cyanobacteria bacterium J007]
MAKKNSYRDYLKQEFSDLIDQLELPELEKRFMKSRWLDQVLWLEGKADKTRQWSLRLRLTTIVGGVVIPALVSLNFNDSKIGRYIGWFTFGLSQVVAVSAAIDEYFHYGEKSTQYRQTAESLKSEGWYFLQLSGPYHKYTDYKDAYAMFSGRIENYIKSDVEAIVEMAKQKAQDEEEKGQSRQGQYLPAPGLAGVPAPNMGNAGTVGMPTYAEPTPARYSDRDAARTQPEIESPWGELPDEPFARGPGRWSEERVEPDTSLESLGVRAASPQENRGAWEEREGRRERMQSGRVPEEMPPEMPPGRPMPMVDRADPLLEEPVTPEADRTPVRQIVDREDPLLAEDPVLAGDRRAQWGRRDPRPAPVSPELPVDSEPAPANVARPPGRPMAREQWEELEQVARRPAREPHSSGSSRESHPQDDDDLWHDLENAARSRSMRS